MKTNNKVVATVLTMLSECLNGAIEITKTKINTWTQVLQDIDSEFVVAAAWDFATSDERYPPSVGKLRRRAVELSMGTLAPISGYEAWERALRASRGEYVDMSPEETRALAYIGGTWTIKHSQSHAMDRASYVKFYNSIIDKKFRIAATPENIKQLAAKQSCRSGRIGHIGDKLAKIVRRDGK